MRRDGAHAPFPGAARRGGRCRAGGVQRAAGQGQGDTPAGWPAAAGTASAPPQSTTPLVVPAGEGGGALSTPRTLTVPAGWTARVWARVPGARMEAWTPEGDLLVSEPGHGTIAELRPDGAGTATMTPVLSGLTNPQGMAFARLNGRWVLYVAESDQVDRYPWGPGGISGARTIIARGLPDLDPAGDDVHRREGRGGDRRRDGLLQRGQLLQRQPR